MPILLILAYLGGVLTILSPCVLPIIPLVFARADRPFRRDAVPMLAGLAMTFALVATAATASAAWLLRANEVGRYIGLLLFAGIGVSLLSPWVARAATRPLSRLGAWIEQHVRVSGAWRHVAIGAAIGLLWAPCAGPILGLIIAAAALGRSAAGSALLFLAFALGAVTSLGAAIFAGGRALATLKRYRVGEVWVRRALGVATLATLLLMALGWDRDLFAKGGLVATVGAEELLISTLNRRHDPAARRDNGTSLDEFAAEHAGPALAEEGAFPGFAGATAWINSAPLSAESLKGKVVMVDFWTFDCYNCLNALPHVKALEAKYRDRGLVVVGVHTPEFPREKIESNVRRAVRKLGITYPVVMDNEYAIWNAFGNRYWPAAYFVDASGAIRFHHFGEGRYDEQEQVVQKLLAEARGAK